MPLHPVHHLINVVLDETRPVQRKPEVEQERLVALRDLLEDSVFEVLAFPHAGPYILRIGVGRVELTFEVQSQEGQPLSTVVLPAKEFYNIVRDYLLMCDQYYNHADRRSLEQIEAVDMARRSLHNEGSVLIKERLAPHFSMDDTTARRLFTLLSVLHIRG